MIRFIKQNKFIEVVTFIITSIGILLFIAGNTSCYKKNNITSFRYISNYSMRIKTAPVFGRLTQEIKLANEIFIDPSATMVWSVGS